jgi:hypothetical protein
MGKLYGIHEIELQPGVSEEAFANFINQEFNEAYAWTGWKTILLKGDRGERAGKYAILFKIESLEARDSILRSEESKRWFEEHKELADNLSKKLTSFTPTDLGEEAPFYTDYVELD